MPPTVRRLSFAHPLPADCPTLACVEEVRVELLQDCTALDVTKFPNARVLRAYFDDVSDWEDMASSDPLFQRLFQGPRATITEISRLEQLAALAQLTRVELNSGELVPGEILTQLPAGCELLVQTSGSTLCGSLPHDASLAHLVTLHISDYYCHDICNLHVEFSCLASCPNLRDHTQQVWLEVIDYDGNHELTTPHWVDLSPSMMCHPTA